MKTLIFIDTNIFLDFYRYSGHDVNDTLLELITLHKDVIITSNQVEMEFKKNRQAIILKTLDTFKTPSLSELKIPPILKDNALNRNLSSSKKYLRETVERIRKKFDKILMYPDKYDKIYTTSMGLFRSNNELNLSRDKPIRFTIRRQAHKRYLLGYPPRKKDDTSFSDAINWEWIVHCAKCFKTNIAIVSRDSDYGIRKGEISLINDWLKCEFRERTTRKRHVTLTNKLTDALSIADIRVPKNVRDNEKKMVASLSEFDRIEDVIQYAYQYDLDIMNVQFEMSGETLIINCDRKFTGSDVFENIKEYANNHGVRLEVKTR